MASGCDKNRCCWFFICISGEHRDPKRFTESDIKRYSTEIAAKVTKGQNNSVFFSFSSSVEFVIKSRSREYIVIFARREQEMNGYLMCCQ